MRILKFRAKKIRTILAIFLIFQFMLLGVALAQEDTEQRRRPTASPDDVKTKRITLKIIAKQPEMIRTKHRNFLVTESTELVDRKGNHLTLSELPVPCRATIFYEPKRLNNTYAWRIIYKGKFTGASTAWSAPLKQ
jgi:hypothetical protein